MSTSGQAGILIWNQLNKIVPRSSSSWNMVAIMHLEVSATCLKTKNKKQQLLLTFMENTEHNRHCKMSTQRTHYGCILSIYYPFISAIQRTAAAVAIDIFKVLSVTLKYCFILAVLKVPTSSSRLKIVHIKHV